MTAVSTLGIDLAKNTFSVHGVDAQGVVTVRRTVSRAKLGELVAFPPLRAIALDRVPNGVEQVLVAERLRQKLDGAGFRTT